MKKTLVVAAALAVLPIGAQAQTLQYPGFLCRYRRAAATTCSTTTVGKQLWLRLGQQRRSVGPLGAMIGYDFLSVRVS